MEVLGGAGALLALIAAWLLWMLRARLRGQRPDAEEVETLPPDLQRRIPPTLHPVVDPSKCIGSAACVPACPEGRVLRLHDGYAHLVEPQRCIGHGACARECPMGAITLVFGTAERGVDIPHVTETFETNVRGVYIAGELGGMGLIRNAVRQGVEAAEYIARDLASQPREAGSKAAGPENAPAPSDPLDLLDVLIVGAGPAGLAAGLEAQRRGLRVQLIDQERELGGTTARYPRKKVVMLGALELPGRKPLRRREISKEELMEIWRDVVGETSLPIALGQQLKGLTGNVEAGFEATTNEGTWRARRVLLAIGRRGTPRKLGVPGEDLPNVAYALREPEEWRGTRCLVVGGGDSALEAALALSQEGGAVVALSYRGDSFFRAKPTNQERMKAAQEAGEVAVYFQTVVRRIEPERVVLGPSAQGDAPGVEGVPETVLPIGQVFIFAGGELPTGLLKAVGVQMERKFGTR